jgi:hypothetical protein
MSSVASTNGPRLSSYHSTRQKHRRCGSCHLVFPSRVRDANRGKNPASCGVLATECRSPSSQASLRRNDDGPSCDSSSRGRCFGKESLHRLHKGHCFDRGQFRVRLGKRYFKYIICNRSKNNIFIILFLMAYVSYILKVFNLVDLLMTRIWICRSEACQQL